MSHNSRHSLKMQKKFDKEQTALRVRAGKQIEAPTPPQPEPIGEIFEFPDPRTLEVLRRSHAV